MAVNRIGQKSGGFGDRIIGPTGPQGPSGTLPTSLGINAQTGTTYTLTADDNGKLVTLNNASSITLTVPSGLPVGFNCSILQLGAGQVFVSSSGVSVYSRVGYRLSGQYAAASIVEYAENVLVLSGDTTL